MKNNLIFLCFVSLFLSLSCGTEKNENFEIEWQTIYDAGANDMGYHIQQTPDGGFIACGTIESNGLTTGIILKLNSSGKIKWTYIQPPLTENYIDIVILTSTGNYLFTDSALTETEDFNVNIGFLDKNGNLIKTFEYGGPGLDSALSAIENPSGNFYIGIRAGEVDVEGYNFKVFEIDPEGNLLNEITSGYEGYDELNAMALCPDEGIILAGSSTFYDFNNQDCRILKLDSELNIEWERGFDESVWDTAATICPTSDGGYIFGGAVVDESSGAHLKYFVVKTDASGKTEWSDSYGENANSIVISINETPDKGFIIMGRSWPDAETNEYIHAVKTDESGEILWERQFLSAERQFQFPIYLSSVCATEDGGFVTSGYLENENGNLDIRINKFYPPEIILNGISEE